MDYWGRSGGLSVVPPCVFVAVDSHSFQAGITGPSDAGFFWHSNIFGGPALTRDRSSDFLAAIRAPLSANRKTDAWRPTGREHSNVSMA
jgi:hypothetical protein